MVTHSSELKGNTFQPDIYEKLLPLLPADKSASILDVGAGSGFSVPRCGSTAARI